MGHIGPHRGPYGPYQVALLSPNRPYQALPGLMQIYLALCNSMPYQALPSPTSPYQAPPGPGAVQYRVLYCTVQGPSRVWQPYQVLPSPIRPTRPYVTLPGPTQPYVVLPGPHRTWKGHIGLCRAWQGHIGLCRAQQDHIGLCRTWQGHIGLCRDSQGLIVSDRAQLGLVGLPGPCTVQYSTVHYTILQQGLVGPGRIWLGSCRAWYGMELHSATYGYIRPGKAWQGLVGPGSAWQGLVEPPGRWPKGPPTYIHSLIMF